MTVILMGGHTALRSSVIITVSAGFVIVAVGAAAIRATLDFGPAYPLKALTLFAGVVVLVGASVGTGHRFATFGAANAVTTARVAFVTLVAALVGERASTDGAIVTVAIATGVTVCDGLDGWLARRTNRASGFGARFDMETDALLVMALSILVWAYGKAGAWIVLSGLLRYLFVAAGWTWAWMRQPLPPRFRRKLVCVIQIVALLVVLLPAMRPPASAAIAAASLVLLAWSFAVDVAWLRARPTTAGARASLSS